MAKDMLDAVYAAEEEFRRREGEAKKQADKTVADAKKEAEALIDARMAKANADADAELAKAKAACDKLMQQAEADAKAECKSGGSIVKLNQSRHRRQSPRVTTGVITFGKTENENREDHSPAPRPQAAAGAFAGQRPGAAHQGGKVPRRL